MQIHSPQNFRQGVTKMKQPECIDDKDYEFGNAAENSSTKRILTAMGFSARRRENEATGVYR